MWACSIVNVVYTYMDFITKQLQWNYWILLSCTFIFYFLCTVWRLSIGIKNITTYSKHWVFFEYILVMHVLHLCWSSGYFCIVFSDKQLRQFKNKNKLIINLKGSPCKVTDRKRGLPLTNEIFWIRTKCFLIICYLWTPWRSSCWIVLKRTESMALLLYEVVNFTHPKRWSFVSFKWRNWDQFCYLYVRSWEFVFIFITYYLFINH